MFAVEVKAMAAHIYQLAQLTRRTTVNMAEVLAARLAQLQPQSGN